METWHESYFPLTLGRSRRWRRRGTFQGSRECRLAYRVKSPDLALRRPLPVLPNQRTSPDQPSWSVPCQERTRAPQQLSSLFDHLVGAGEQGHWNVKADMQGVPERLFSMLRS